MTNRHRSAILLSFALQATLSGCSCDSSAQDDDDMSEGGGGDTAGPGGAGAQGGGGAGAGGEGGAFVLPESFLPTPEAEGTVRIVVEGGAWSGFDRECGNVIEADSYYSVSFGNAYIFYDAEGCDPLEGNASLVQLFREAGLGAGGIFPISVGGPNIGKVAVSPPDYPWPESELDGEAYVEVLEVGSEDTLIAATWYGTSRWRDSDEDPESEADVTVRVAMRVRVRNVDVP